MPRAKMYGYIALAASVVLGTLFIKHAFIDNPDIAAADFSMVSMRTYYILSIPIGLITAVLLGTGLWIGWTILTIKVAPPMPEIVEKRDFTKTKAVFLCLITLSIACAFAYGLYVRSFWALAIPASAITIVILGMIFWVGIAIITTRSTLPQEKK